MNNSYILASTNYLSDYETKLNQLNAWYPPILTGLLSLVMIVGLLSFIIRKS